MKNEEEYVKVKDTFGKGHPFIIASKEYKLVNRNNKYTPYCYTIIADNNQETAIHPDWLDRDFKKSKEIQYYEVIKAFPGVKMGDKFIPHDVRNETVTTYSGSSHNTQNFKIPSGEINNIEFFKPIYKAKYALPRINNYQGEKIDNYIKFGCATLGVQYLIDLYKMFSQNISYGFNRSLISIKLDSGVEITKQHLEQIIQYLENEK